MNRLSSNSTLMWKFFIPTFYISFVGLFLLAVLVLEDDISTFSSTIVKISIVFLYFLFIFLMWLTIMRLKRVEEHQDAFFVSDYFKTFKYLKSDIQSMKSSNYGLLNIITITMKSKTTMGKKIRFIGSNKVMEDLV